MKTCLLLLMVCLLSGCNRNPTGLNDSELKAKLSGAWTYALTNNEGVGFVGDVIYNTNGSTIWRGTMVQPTGEEEVFEFTGLWNVHKGNLCTRASGAAFPHLLPQHEFRDRLLAVTDTEVKYRTTDGVVDTRYRKR